MPTVVVPEQVAARARIPVTLGALHESATVASPGSTIAWPLLVHSAATGAEHVSVGAVVSCTVAGRIAVTVSPTSSSTW